MYLREMGTVELLSREGEIAIAKRIEAGREAMIAGLCESPLTFQAIIIWRDELNEGKIFLRDIIDLEATYAGPEAKGSMNPQLAAPNGGEAGGRWRRRRGRRVSRARACRASGRAAAADPVPRPSLRLRLRATPWRRIPASLRPKSDMDDDEFENQMSLAAIEAELKPKVVETFDKIASEYKKLRTPAGAGHRQPAAERVAVALAGAQVQEAQGRDHRRGEVAAPEPGPYRLAWSSSSTTSTRSWSRSRAA